MAVWERFRDPECPIDRYDVALIPYPFNTSKMNESIAWMPARTQLSMMLPTNMTLGLRHVILVRAHNAAGLTSIAVSDGAIYQTSTKNKFTEESLTLIAGTVKIEPRDQFQSFTGWLGTNHAMHVSWYGFKGTFI